MSPRPVVVVGRFRVMAISLQQVKRTGCHRETVEVEVKHMADKEILFAANAATGSASADFMDTVSIASPNMHIFLCITCITRL